MFEKLLTYFMVYRRLPFATLDSPWFRAFVWYLDPTISIPSRPTWARQHLPQAASDYTSDVKASSIGVHDVTLLFDLWMSRGGEEPDALYHVHCLALISYL